MSITVTRGEGATTDPRVERVDLKPAEPGSAQGWFLSHLAPLVADDEPGVARGPSSPAGRHHVSAPDAVFRTRTRHVSGPSSRYSKANASSPRVARSA